MSLPISGATCLAACNFRAAALTHANFATFRVSTAACHALKRRHRLWPSSTSSWPAASMARSISSTTIDRAIDAAGQELVELGHNLCRRFKAWHAAVETRNVAKFACVRAAARKLHAAKQVAPDIGKLIGRKWELPHVAASLGYE